MGRYGLNHAFTPDCSWVCLSECCHGDDGLLRGMEHTLLYQYLVVISPGEGGDHSSWFKD